MTRKKRVLLVVCGDMHTASKTGLMAPGFVTTSGHKIGLNKWQRWMWKNWYDCWTQYIPGLVKKFDCDVVVVFNGDSLDKNKHAAHELLVHSEVDIVRMGSQVIAPVLSAANQVFFVKGTEAHTGKDHVLEELLAENIVPGTINEHNLEVVRPDNHSWAWHHLYLDVRGVSFDIQHHPESGFRTEHTQGAAASRIAHAVELKYFRINLRPPDWTLRNHRHAYADSGAGTYTTRAIMVPAWQGPTNFIYRIASGFPLPDVGICWFLCENKQTIDWDRKFYKSPRPRPTKVAI